MRILLLCHAFNSLSQRLFVELKAQSHDVSVEFDINDESNQQAVDLFRPDLIIAPYLKRAIAEDIWNKTVCLVVHPGIIGDRGPSAVDWAILNQEPEWGVTLLQANAEMDGGDIWASANFPMRKASKSSLYRNEITNAAVKAVNMALQHFQEPGFKPTPLKKYINGARWQPYMTQTDRSINWHIDNSDTIIRKVHSADGFPGVRHSWFNRELYLYDAFPESELSGNPGEIIGRSETAICIATIDSAIWIGHLMDKQCEHPFKLPATIVLKDELKDIPHTSDNLSLACHPIRYRSADDVGYLSFNFYNGAMSTTQCRQLHDALIRAKQMPTKIIVLLGGQDFWSNGMHLNQIEAARSAADESWENINAIDDLALEIINTDSQLIISAMQGNAGAGGVFLSRAADEVWARKSIILNPHYKDMGNLYGSEYWTYLLPRYAGQENVEMISQTRLPMGTTEALSLGLVDRIIDTGLDGFIPSVERCCMEYLNATKDQPSIQQRLETKRKQRVSDEASKPLAAYRDEELSKMKQNFYGFDPSYHMARYNFVYKIPKSHTPLTLAKHRTISHRPGKINHNPQFSQDDGFGS